MKKLVLSLAVLMFLVGVAPAANNWSNDGADNLWTTPDNWTKDRVPHGGDLVNNFKQGEVHEIQIETGMSALAFELRMSGLAAAGGSFIEMSGGYLEVRENFRLGNGDNEGGVFTMTDGLIDVGTNNPRNFVVGNHGVGSFTMTDGTINVSRTMDVGSYNGIDGRGYGTVVMLGGVIDIDNSNGADGLWMNEDGDSTLDIAYDAQIVMNDHDGGRANRIQRYIDNGIVVSSIAGWEPRVNHDTDTLTTTLYAVPEPATMVLLGLGGLGLLRKCR